MDTPGSGRADPDLSRYGPRPRPSALGVTGAWTRLEPLDWAQHGADLAQAVLGPERAALWRYLPDGPHADLASFERAYRQAAERNDWITLAIRPLTLSPIPPQIRSAPGVSVEPGPVAGTAAYMRIRPEHGSVEVGHVLFGPALQRTSAATEAMYLMARHVFDDLGYRRYEWKCNRNNAASMRAAARYGFVFEGVFRNDMVVKGESRDTAWFSITDAEWPAVKAGFQAWLAPDNFDPAGAPKRSLAACRG